MSRPTNFCPRCGAPLHLRLLDHRERPVCDACGFVYYLDPKTAVVAFVVHEDKLLLVQRAGEPRKGEWALPAGFVEHDEAPADAALRELLEETGVQGEIIGLLDVFPKRDDGMADIVIAYAVRWLAGEPHPMDDAAQVAWVSRADLPDLAFFPSRSLAQRWREGRI